MTRVRVKDAALGRLDGATLMLALSTYDGCIASVSSVLGTVEELFLRAGEFEVLPEPKPEPTPLTVHARVVASMNEIPKDAVVLSVQPALSDKNQRVVSYTRGLEKRAPPPKPAPRCFRCRGTYRPNPMNLTWICNACGMIWDELHMHAMGDRW